MTLYRQILDINPSSPVASDINELHKLVMAGFRDRLNPATVTGGAVSPRTRANILFAARRKKAGNKQVWPPTAGSAYRLLVQGDTPGDWSTTSYATDQTLALTVHDPFPVTLDLDEGSLVEVATEINATRRLAAPMTKDAMEADRAAALTEGRPPTKTRGARVSITKPTDVGRWLTNTLTASEGVAEVTPTGIHVSAPTRLYGRRGPGQGHLTIDTCHITAQVHVADPDQFVELLKTGIGRSRAYGAGLIRHRILA